MASRYELKWRIGVCSIAQFTEECYWFSQVHLAHSVVSNEQSLELQNSYNSKWRIWVFSCIAQFSEQWAVSSEQWTVLSVQFSDAVSCTLHPIEPAMWSGRSSHSSAGKINANLKSRSCTGRRAWSSFHCSSSSASTCWYLCSCQPLRACASTAKYFPSILRQYLAITR